MIMAIADEKYVSFTTFRRNGERKSLPVWIVEFDGGIGFTTGRDSWKLKRLMNDPRCELQPSNARGVVAEGAMVVTGTAREATAEEHREISAAVAEKYGFQVTLIQIPNKIKGLFGRAGDVASTSIVVTLD